MTSPLQVDVFASGENGYHTFRIPVIEAAADGSLLAFAEARKHNRVDPGYDNNQIALVLKRSSDRGRTWSPMTVIEDPGECWSAANPTSVLDRQNGRVWLHYLRGKPGRSTATARPGSDDIENLVRHSDDHGVTWSASADITAVCRDLADSQWRCTVVGPGGGIQDRQGRLVVPCWKVAPEGVFAVFSEDHGQTWQRGHLALGPEGGTEGQLVELADGRILLDFRQSTGPGRWMAVSSDGGRIWSAPRPGQIVTPVCCAIERCTPRSAGDDGNWRGRHGRERHGRGVHDIVWTGPKGPGRANLVARISDDEAESFTRERPIAEGPAAYSDLTSLADGSVGVLWERDDYRFITFALLDQEFLQPRDR
jgi:sialidase-1